MNGRYNTGARVYIAGLPDFFVEKAPTVRKVAEIGVAQCSMKLGS